MIESIIASIERWNTTKNERQKLQGVYSGFGVVIVLLAGVVTFLNVQAGYTLLNVGLVFLGVFLLNAVAWHLLSSIFLSQLKSKPKKK
jgi:multisubunit Na+/H+ antiporter MnhG subunit